VAVGLGARLVAEVWGDLYREAAQGAAAKIENVLPDAQRQEMAWARRSLLATRLHRCDPVLCRPWLQILRRACREQHTVSLLYHSRSRPEPTRRELDPYALVYRWGWWYVVGFCHLRQSVRSFRVDRIQELTLLERSFVLPDDLDVNAYLASEPQPQAELRVCLRFAPELAALARGDFAYWDSAEEQPDGSLLVTMAAYDLEHAASWAASWGPLAEVLEPEALRRLLYERALATQALYAPVPSPPRERG
jgi:predicted DNA-binding transcriptional regulator YafY